jgi:hypothetical protein
VGFYYSQIHSFELRSKVIARIGDNGDIVDNHCLNFFII